MSNAKLCGSMPLTYCPPHIEKDSNVAELPKASASHAHCLSLNWKEIPHSQKDKTNNKKVSRCGQNSHGKIDESAPGIILRMIYLLIL